MPHSETDSNLPVRVLIADDHELVRRGLCSLLESRPGWRVIGQAKDGVEAVDMVEELEPDLVILDITMPRMNGLDAARKIHENSPETPILMLSQHDSQDMAQKAIEVGARCYVSKSDIAIELFTLMRSCIDPTDA